MSLFIVHLSDFHIKSTERIIESRLKSLINTINDACGSVDQGLILISGDVAFSGQKSEYIIANEFLNKIVDGCKNIIKLDVVACPGNHDCNMRNEQFTRDSLIDAVMQKSNFEQKALEIITSGFDEYKNFISNFMKPILNDFVSVSYLYRVRNINVTLKSINSAWCAKKKCVPGSLTIDPEWVGCSASHSNVRICLMHNTDNWFVPDLHKKIRQQLIKNYDYVFTGHEHESFHYHYKTLFDRKSSIMIEGGELNPTNGSRGSSFNIVIIDHGKRRYSLSTYVYDEDSSLYRKSPESPDGWVDAKAKSSLPSLSGYVVNDDLQLRLADPGAPYKHPILPVLTLDDIFIYPNVRDISFERGSRETGKIAISSVRTVTQQGESGRLLLFGGEKSGKSAICRRIFADKLKDGFVPILLQGELLGVNATPESFDKALKQCASEHYLNFDLAGFVNIDDKKKYIIIDDFHLAKCSLKKKSQILKHIARKYDNALICLDDSLQLEEILYIDEDGVKLSSLYGQYQLMLFGNKLRYQLVQRWYCGGDAGDVVIDNEMLAKIDTAIKMLDIVVSRNLVPAFPFYLYTAISAFDVIPKGNIAESSYGHYYSTLLTLALAKINVRNEEIELRGNYLAELARHFFEKKRAVLTCADVSKFHAWYCDEYSIDAREDGFLSGFCTASILQKRDDYYFFKYKYFYYYFLARSLSNSMTSESTKNIIREFCKTLHLETSSNTIMFLTHLSKDPFVLDEIAMNARRIFAENKPLTLEDDVAIVNTLIEEQPKISCPAETDVVKFRSDCSALQDELSPPPDLDDFRGDKIEMGSVGNGEEALALTLNASFKTLDIMGQILKNYYGSLKGGQKNELCCEAYNVTRRALANFFEYLVQKKEYIITEIEQFLGEKGLVEHFEKEKEARRFVFNISVQLSFAFIYRTALSIGSSNLEKTFAQIRLQDDSVAVKLIDMAIKLDSNALTPTEEITRLSQELEGNMVAHMILQQLGLLHIYMHKTTYDTKQKLCNALKIPIKDQLAIEHEAKAKKIH